MLSYLIANKQLQTREEHVIVIQSVITSLFVNACESCINL